MRRLAGTPPWLLAAVLAALYLLLDPRSADLAAQAYRADLWSRVGFTVWDNGWYSGHHVPAYSLLFPPLGAWLGPQVVGALSAVAGTWAFGRLTGREHRLAGAWAALGMATLLVTNRLTFALGVALGLAALSAARSAVVPNRSRARMSVHPSDTDPRSPVETAEADGAPRLARAPASRRPRPDALLRQRLLRRTAIALAALCSAASPVAGAFLALAAAAWWLGEEASPSGRARGNGRGSARTTDGVESVRRAWMIAFGLASVAPAAVVSLMFPEGGTFPFALSSFLPALAGTLLVLAVLPPERRVLRAGVALSALLLMASWALPTPMGGNAVRLGALFAGPTLAIALLPARRGRTLVLFAPALLYWQLAAPVENWRQTAGDPTVRARAYTGLKTFLSQQDGPPYRVEVAFTANHWEAAQLTDTVPLARGWERQYDRKVNGLFYDGEPLTAERYRRWLDDNAVRFVALADAPIDDSAAEEAALVRTGPPYLRRVYADRIWSVWEVLRPRPIGVTALPPDGFTTAGAGPVQIRWSPYFTVVGGRGCVRRAPDGYTVASGPVRVRAEVSVAGALRRDEHCR